METLSTTTDQVTINKIQRISAFFSRQDNFTFVLIAWMPDGDIISQVLPGANAALAVLREACKRQRSSAAASRGRTRQVSAPARLARLESQVDVCARALKSSGVEFVLSWQIAGQDPELVFHSGPARQDPVRDVIVVLERAARSHRDITNRVPGELVESQW
jgi:hypothetical protein